MSSHHAPCSSASDFSKKLKENRERIIQIWIERLKAEIPPPQTTPRNYLVNSLPLYLDQLADCLERQKPHVQEAGETARKHAEERFEFTEFSLAQVLNEYKVLRQVIFDVLEDGDLLSARARDVILDFLQTGSAAMASEYMRLQENKLQLERESREQFVATLSHDLKTPLSAARLAAQLLIRKLNEPFLEDILNRTLRNIDRADKMIENLLDANMLRAGQPLQLITAPADLVQIANGAAGDMNGIYRGRCKIKTSKGKIEGYWSPSQLTRCFENLIGNAAKYGDPGKPITIALEGAAHSVSFSVQNYGVPIPADQLEEIFSPYQRVSSAVSAGKKGWGLGLAIVKGIVDAHKGKIDVRSGPREGTAFTVTLPRDCRPHEKSE